jgi:phage shock protein C
LGDIFAAITAKMSPISAMPARLRHGGPSADQGSIRVVPRCRRPPAAQTLDVLSSVTYAGKADDIMSNMYDTFRSKGLVRPQEGRLLAGVFAGVGRRFGLDPWPSRILFSLLLLVIPGSQILLYPILWVAMPSEEQPATPPGAVPAT